MGRGRGRGLGKGLMTCQSKEARLNSGDGQFFKGKGKTLPMRNNSKLSAHCGDHLEPYTLGYLRTPPHPLLAGGGGGSKTPLCAQTFFLPPFLVLNSLYDPVLRSIPRQC